MTDPATLEEYNARATASMWISGFGLDVVSSLPCPGCAAPDWLAFPITAALNGYADVQDSRECAECGRSFQLVIALEGGGAASGGTTSMDIVQTGGPDVPSYLPPMGRDVH